MFHKKESFVYTFDRKLEELIREARDFDVSIKPYRNGDEVGLVITDGKEKVFKPIGNQYIINK